MWLIIHTLYLVNWEDHQYSQMVGHVAQTFVIVSVM